MSIGSKLCTLATALTFVFLMPQRTSAIGTAAIDGNEVLNRCKAYLRTIDSAQAASQTDFVDGGFCVGYVTGVIDDHFTWQISEASPTDPTKHFCMPDGATTGQAVRVVVKWLEDHPARLHERAIDLVLSALRDNFPCRR